LGSADWQCNKDGVLALKLGRCLVYANFSEQIQAIVDGDRTVELAPQTSGWSFPPERAASRGVTSVRW
jgi:hypothetical protein